MTSNQNPDIAYPSGNRTPSEKIMRVAIVGAGCTGLRLAHLLTLWQREQPTKRRLEITLFESSSRIGGLLHTAHLASGLRIEAAAQGVLGRRTVFLQTLEDLGLTPSDVITPPPNREMQTRFVVAPSGRMAPLTGPSSLVAAGVLSVGALLRALSELFRKPASPPNPNETLYQFTERRFGRSVAENLIVPFTTGVWGGGAEHILVRHAFPILPELEARHGGVLRGLIAQKISGSETSKSLSGTTLKHQWPQGLISFPQGMQTLVDALQGALRLWTQADAKNVFDLRLSAPVSSVENTPHQRIALNGKDEFDSVFWTAAPWKAQDLRWSDAKTQNEWTSLHDTPVHSLVVVNVSGARDAFTKNGFGVLARRESDGLLGVLFVHSIYPQHVPEGSYSYRVLLAGDRRPEMIDWSDERLTEYTLAQLEKLELIAPNQRSIQVNIVRWPNAVPLADREHDERQKALWRIQAHFPRVAFAGIYKKGVGVADALQSAQECFDDWKRRMKE